MPTPDEYRKIAETYYRLACDAKTEADRLALLDLAKSWLEAASRDDTKSLRERRRSWRARAARPMPLLPPKADIAESDPLHRQTICCEPLAPRFWQPISPSQRCDCSPPPQLTWGPRINFKAASICLQVSASSV